MRRTNSLLRTMLAYLLVVGCAGCFPSSSFSCGPVDPCARRAVTVAQDFERECAGPLCGFEVLSGSPEIVGTLHPGEHGMRLPAGAGVRLRLSGSRILRSTERLALVVRCDDGASLVVTEELGTDDAGATEVPVNVGAGVDWTATDVVFNSSYGGASSQYVTPRGLRFAASGNPGTSCTIDRLDYAAYQNACFDSGPSRSDAAGDIARDVPRDTSADVLADVGFFPESGCTTNAQCGAGGRCLTQFPRGMCTRACTNDRACGPSGVCEPNLGLCLPSCVPGAADGDQYGGYCTPTDVTGAVSACIWSCFPAGDVNTPTGYPTCSPATTCDVYSGACGQPPPTGVDDGGPCTADADCKGGRCVTEIDGTTGAPTGWIGGYCLSFARQSEITQGQPVPQSNCPPGAGVVPLDGQYSGDRSTCFAVCDETHLCRVGYQCDLLTPSSGTGDFFSNGICLPVDCARTGMTCPAGYHCEVPPSDAALPPGICVAGRGDAGVAADGSGD
ncbi:MAG: hypothetical protein WCJ30_09620 [Deltaproteobacteria bacterium]